MNESLTRALLGVVVPATAVSAVVVPYLALRSELPDRVATRFDGSGTPTRSMTPGMLIVTSLIIAGVGLAGCWWLSWRRTSATRQVAATVGFIGGTLAGLGAGVALLTVLGQRNVDDWRDASIGWLSMVAMLGLGLGLGAVCARLATQLPHRDPTERPSAPPVMVLRDGQQAVWARTVRSRPLAVVALAVLVLGTLQVFWTAWWTLVPAVVAGVAVLSLATVRLRADRTGFHVRFGILPWPRVSIGIEEIRSAEILDVRPMEWGGWGYRGSLKLMKQAALVHRAGPGIRLDLTGDRVFVVTVDRPDEAAALLNAEIGRRTVPSS